MNRFFPASEEEIVMGVTSQLLGEFRTMCPAAVEEALTAFRNGQSLEQAGRVVLIAIQLTQDKLRQEASEKQKLLQKSVDELKDQLAESQRNLTQIESQNKDLQYLSELQADELIDLKDTVIIQNRLLARQQQKLQNLLGNSIDDE